MTKWVLYHMHVGIEYVFAREKTEYAPLLRKEDLQ